MEADLNYKAIGRRIRKSRRKKGLTQEQLSEYTDISISHLSNIETGRTKLSLTAVVCIANALCVSLDYLLADNIIYSRAVFEVEVSEVLEDCSEYEVRVLSKVLAAVKDALRDESDLLRYVFFNRYDILME